VIITPYIYFIAIISDAKDQFWSSVIATDNIRGIFPLAIELLRATKVTNLDLSFLISEYILWFQVTMAHLLIMNVEQTF
jgi:hypothetical protein